LSEDEDKEAEEKIRRELKKAGNAIEPQDKDALAKIREKTGASQAGNGKKAGKGSRGKARQAPAWPGRAVGARHG
jgi:hypothetical protein